MKEEKAIYGISAEGKPMNTQRELLLDYLKQHPGRAVSQNDVREMWGFTRLSAIVKDVEYKMGVYLKREKRASRTRWGVVTYPTFYWYEERTND